MESLCRLCSHPSTVLTPLLSLNSGRLILDMVTTIIPLKLEISDSFPSQICSKCLKIVIAAFDLRAISVESDINFRLGHIQQLPETPNVKQEEEDYQAAVTFEGESESELSYGQDEDEAFQVVNYEPKEKRAKTEFKCDRCYESLGSKFLLNQHKREIHKIFIRESRYNPLKKAVCPHCQIVIPQRYNLARHIKRNHDPKLPIKCTQCSYRFSTESRLKAHEVKEHEMYKINRRSRGKEEEVKDEIVEEFEGCDALVEGGEMIMGD